jgi:hypothetical protein
MAKAASWFDEATNKPIIDEHTKKLSTFIDAMADGQIEAHELAAQEERLVAAMRAVEAELTPEQHAKVTKLLTELTAYDIMQMLNSLEELRPKTVFRG